MTELVVRVLGKPVQQGSKTAGIMFNGGRPRAFLRDANSATLKPWRQAVTTQARNALGSGQKFGDIPLELDLVFYFERPSKHYRTGKFSHILKDGAPTHVATTPDVDKLARAILDSLTDAAVYPDDSRVVRITAEKRYAAEGQPPGALITIRPHNPPNPTNQLVHPIIEPTTPGALF